MREFLKVKIKSLAAEATFIRKEENKAKASFRYLKNKQGEEARYQRALDAWDGLRRHRIFDVRDEARASLLAYAFIRGKSFSYVEASTKILTPYGTLNPDLNSLLGKVARMATKYGDKDVDADAIKKWIRTDEQIKNAA